MTSANVQTAGGFGICFFKWLQNGSSYWQDNRRAIEGELGRLFFALRRFSDSASSIGKEALIDIDCHPPAGVPSLQAVQRESMSDVAQGCFKGAIGSIAGYWVPADHFTPPHFGRVGAGATAVAVAFPSTQATQAGVPSSDNNPSTFHAFFAFLARIIDEPHTSKAVCRHRKCTHQCYHQRFKYTDIFSRADLDLALVMAGGRPGRPPGRPRGSGRPRGTGRRPGRPRKDSDSTVASVDWTNIEYVPELSVLKPVASQNEFPTFVLDDAVIYRKDISGRLEVANVCNVNLEGPLVVRGKLEVEDEDRPHRTPPHLKPWPNIAINVRFY